MSRRRVPHSRIGFVSLIILIVWLGAVPTAWSIPRTDLVAKAGIIGVAITNLGYIGNGLSNPAQPSCEYPLNSNVEHLFLAGLWVGARTADGTIHVSTGAQDATNLNAGDEIREFADVDGLDVFVGSNSQNSEIYHPDALATQHIQVVFDDYAIVESGNHVALGLEVTLRVLAWGNPYADDFIILDYAIRNVSGNELRDVYLGFWSDTTVGNTEITDPYDPQASVRWNYYDDVNGGWGPADWVDPENSVPSDPRIWMAYERDDDGEDGLATSWVGTRLLGSIPAVSPPDTVPPVSYNAWRFRSVPEQDDAYESADGPQPGKYQIMANGDFDVGGDFTAVSDWVSLLSTGPFPYLAPDDTVHVTYALVCAPDSVGLLANSKVAQLAYDEGFTIPTGPPSPRLSFGFDDNTVILKWAPGDTVNPDTGETLQVDDPLRSPEHHISTITGKPDFQGYRIYRFQGETIPDDPYSIATLVAEFDLMDDFGFNTGLPTRGADGDRYFVDRGLLDGFPYWYSVVSFSAPDLEESLPSFSSGFYENGQLLYPGPAPSTPENPRTVNVFPNPYRAGSLFDGQYGERELNRKIWFTGLSEKCRILVYNLAGDLITTINHHDPELGMAAWDILSEQQRAIASGLYIYVVQDEATGDVQRGKLVIIK
ncbi:MAG: hypothetical protein ABIF77_08605 [bacterium]